MPINSSTGGKEGIVTKEKTPLPWHLNYNYAWSDACKDRGPVFVCNLATGTHVPEEQNQINAEFIVRAVSCHDDLTAAVTLLSETMESMIEIQAGADVDNLNSAGASIGAVLDLAKAALAKAKEEHQHG
jgi:hypothetical protein